MSDADLLDRLSRALDGRYRITRRLGEGGMAVVFLADDIRHDRRVAIKVLRPDVASSIGAERFLREIRVTAQLSHPHILPLLDSGDAGGLLFYVMPLVEGESLRELLQRERQLPVDTAVRLATEVAGALGHAHSRGILHRDVKPENILLSNGHALVADFGIARVAHAGEGEARTATGAAIGTVAYMSPEQAAGDRGLDARSDLYSLACVTYEMLTGEAPFTGPTPQAVLARRLTETPRPMRATRDAIPPALDAVVAKALARIPADRQDSLEVFAGELRTAAAGMQLRRGLGWRTPAVLSTVVVILALFAWSLWQRAAPGNAGAPTGAPYRLAVLPLENLGDPEDAPFADGMSDEIMSRLSEVGGINVVSRTSARRFRGTTLSMREVGAEL
ncbi:MAG: serine/threonine-protein kinase, partial [Gemmatimonadetes bacterium]|nr:serine/threonine-protein kinase [Gemmatimonadota bacterium]